MQKIVFHLVKVFDPVTKMDFQDRFQLIAVNLISEEAAIWKPLKAMQQYLKRKNIKSSVRDCIAAMPDNPACYQLVFGDDYFWS